MSLQGLSYRLTSGAARGNQPDDYLPHFASWQRTELTEETQTNGRIQRLVVTPVAESYRSVPLGRITAKTLV
jgi:hypothetical protein